MNQPTPKSIACPTAGKLDLTHAGHIGYQHSGIEITVLGGIRLEGLDRMRVTLKVQVEHLSIRHNLDLYNDNQVEKLVRKVAEKLEIGTSVITAALTELTDLLEQYRIDELEKQGAGQHERRKILTEEEQQYGCLGRATITVEDKLPPFVELGEDVTLCKDEVRLQVEPGHVTYDWSNGETGASIEPQASGKYWVTVTNEYGIAADTIRVFSFSDIFIPNVLTLNHDYKNEKFEITGLSPGVYPYLKIVDRWGREVFSKNDYQGEWPAENTETTGSTYYYIASYPQCRTYKGWIHILK